MTRQKMPQRRHCEVIEFQHLSPLGHPSPYLATVGRYEDGRIGELFLDGKMASSEAGALAHDAAILISIALQHGVAIGELQAAMARGQGGHPHSVIGTVLDLLFSEQMASGAVPTTGSRQ